MAAPRRIQVHSVLGPDQLLIRSATVSEQLGCLTAIELELLSPDEAIELDKLLGRGISVELALDGDATRFFHGLVAEYSQTGRVGNYASYSARVVPWLWLLTRTSDCRIFQQKSVPDILKAVFRDSGTSDFDDALSGTYQPRDYCVQYMETDFNFVSRLMEEEGIYYFFRHEKEKDIVVLCDSVGAHSTAAGYETVSYFPPSENVKRDKDYVSDWLMSNSIQSGKLIHTDFDFIKPRTSLLAQHVTARRLPEVRRGIVRISGWASDGERRRAVCPAPLGIDPATARARQWFGQRTRPGRWCPIRAGWISARRSKPGVPGGIRSPSLRRRRL